MSTFEEYQSFDSWIVEEFSRTGSFTACAVLVSISGGAVTPLCSTYFNVLGDEVGWADVTVLLAGAGRDWDGVSIFPMVRSDQGPLDNPTARLRLHELEERIDEDRLVLNEGQCFDKRGCRLCIEKADLR